MIEFFVKRPVTTIMFIIVFVVLGVFSFSTLLVEKTPRIEFPIITVAVTYPGATSLEVETLVVNKIEDAVSEISQIDQIRSDSHDNFGFVYIEFLLSADVNVKSIEVKDKVEAILNDLPDDIEAPIIEKFDPLMEPVIEIVLSGKDIDSRQLYEYADKTFKTKLASVEGVAKVDVYGGTERQINIRLNPELMKQKYISIGEVIMALKMKNRNIPGGELEKGFSALSVRFVGEFQDVEQIRNFELSSRDGNKFFLDEIAEIEDSFKKVESIARFNSQEVVGLSLNKVSDGNAVDIADQIRKRMDEFKAELPEGMEIQIASDTTDFIKNETTDAQFNIILGILLTIVILYLFTGQASLTFIAAIVIPASIISTFWPVSASGFTINMMTLMAIATALGTLIANAIVIIENVLVHMEHHEDAQHAAVSATQEVAGAILSSTGTNLVVFLPIAMMGGIVGKFFQSFGLTVVYATLFSLIASFTLTPMLCGLLLKKKTGKKKNKFVELLHMPVRATDKTVDFFKREYKRIFDFMFRRPLITILLVILSFYSLSFIMPYIDGEFIPSDDEDKIKVMLVMPKGSTIERTLSVIEIIEQRIKQLPEQKSFLSQLGENGVENATTMVTLVSSKKRARSDLEIIDELTLFMSTIPDAQINIMRIGLGGGEEGDISINVYGKDYEQAIALSQSMQKIMENSGYFRSVSSSYKAPKKEIKFIPDQAKLISYGLTSSDIAQTLRTSIYGDTTNIYKEQGEEYEINIELNDQYASGFADLEQIMIMSSKGLVPITEMGIIEDAKALPTIKHRDRKRVIRLEGYLSKSNTGFVRPVLDKEFKALAFDKGYGYKYVGDAENESEANQEIGKAFLLAMILTYILLAAILNSAIYPIAIMMTVFTSFVGVFYALFFLGYTNNVLSLMGMVMLVGLVVNNAILLLDYTLLKMKQGVPVKEALWLGASEKFRAIIMTSLAVVLGVFPQLWAMMEAKQAMGAVMIGGMLASIIYTLIFIPLVFWYLERMKVYFQQKKLKRVVS
ncbi:MAG: efflux RND transporter permease subunit [Candidatus Omnitrophica bacterium]|nr:efflux RND transporter permease subunit [Candidatus Omnitrophota bacterium]